VTDRQTAQKHITPSPTLSGGEDIKITDAAKRDQN